MYWEIIKDMKFNEDKCLILHLEWSSSRHKLESSPSKRDLGTLVSSRLFLWNSKAKSLAFSMKA